jgi:uncharacterized protein (DUF2062 family)
MIAGALGTAVGNPVTFPFIWASTYEIGHRALKGVSGTAPARLEEDLLHKSWEQILPLLKPMAAGSIPLGIAAGLITYVLVYNTVSAYQQARRDRLASLKVRTSPPNVVAGGGQNT